jgi:ATP-dependent DNA helicase RecG
LRREGNSRITNGELQAMFPSVHSETIRRDLADLVSRGVLLKRGEKRGSYYILHKG